MTTLENNRIFPYQWYVDDKEKEVTCIRVYGINEKGKNMCLRIDDFTPYAYLELPPNIEWTPSKAQLVGNKIDEIMRDQRPLKKVLVYKKKLYGAHVKGTGERKLFPYLFCSFSNTSDLKALGYRIRAPMNVVGCGVIKTKMHESDASPILQLTCCRNISTAGWIDFHGKQVNTDDMLTICDLEYKVKWKHLFPHESNILPKPMIMGFDIEVNSHNPAKFPDAKEPGDKVFQISCVLAREGDHPDDYIPYLLTLGNPDQSITGENVKIRVFKTEEKLLIGFKDLICETNPNIIVGYNILGFDIPYLIDRSKEVCMCFTEFSKQGFHKFNTAKEKTIKWSSSAFKNQEFQFLDAEGRLYVDLLPLVRNNYKMNNYKLKTVSEYFIGETKDPLSVSGIFKCYRVGTVKEKDGSYGPKAQKAMAICGKYCVQDSALVIRLMDKLKTWPGLTEMAKTCQVPIFSLYTQGQQIRVYSQVYKFCMGENIVVEKDGYTVSEGERYVGAHVFPPVPGRYEKVVPFDFASLYPTTIIAYNIDYHTFVTDPSIPDEKCHVMEWRDCIGCQHDPKVIRVNNLTSYIETEQEVIKKLREKRNKTKGVAAKETIMTEIKKKMLELKPYTTERAEINKTKPKFPMCAVRKYRFLKEPKGVIPTVLQNLLDARKHTRKVDMKAIYKEIDKLKSSNNPENNAKIKELQGVIDVLDKRQLAYKVSCNSMYGAMGVRRGYLPFMPGAMCTTYMGRVNIEKVAATIPEKFGGELVYGDTDSNYIHFPHLKTAAETWDHALYVASELTKMFPEPIVLEFEEEIYDFFFILSKKRYMYRKCLRDGVVDDKIGKKGVLLARRDNSKFIRDVYEGCISRIANDEPKDKVIGYVLEQINLMCSGCKPVSDFVVTKAVGDSSGLNVQEFEKQYEKGLRKVKMGDYTIPLLPSKSKNPKEYNDELTKKGVSTAEEYYLSCLPAQVQLAERMRKRGSRVDNGTRIEYVIADPKHHTAKQYEKVESADYMEKHKDVLAIDYLYYIKALANPLDQVLSVAFKDIKDFVLEQYNFRYKVRSKVINELKETFSPDVKFI